MRDRRWTYFVFQGLLTIIILLFFFYHRAGIAHWAGRFAFLSVVFLASLLAMRRMDASRLGSLHAQSAIFLGDSVLASLTLHWTQQPRGEIYLTYFLIIFGTALTRSLRHSFLIATVASVAYTTTAWDADLGLVQETSFWLRLVFLWVMASFAAVLSIDARDERRSNEREHQAQLRQMEQLAAIGRLSGEVAHAIKGPLTTILVDADVLLQRHGTLPSVAAELKEIQDEVGRCRAILQNLLELGRIEEMDFDLFDLREPARGALDRMAGRLAALDAKLELRGFDAPAPVLGDASLLFEAVYEVLQNAEQALAPGGRLRVELRRRLKPAWWAGEGGSPREHFELEVFDDGRGMDAGQLARAFEPFFTTKGSAGTGLGLSSALRILHKHSGTLDAYSEGAGRGTRMVFTLPLFRQAPGS